MRNRAKCVKCDSVIESFGDHDYVSCKCERISIQGKKCIADDWVNFLRVLDDDTTTPVKILDKEDGLVKQEKPSPASKEELFEMLDQMIKNIEQLPPNAMTVAITHYDLLTALLIIQAILKKSNP